MIAALYSWLLPPTALRWGRLDSARFDADRIRRLRPDPFEPLPLPESLRKMLEDRP